MLWTVDHISYITCRYLPGFYTGSNLYCLVTEAQGLIDLPKVVAPAVTERESRLLRRSGRNATASPHKDYMLFVYNFYCHSQVVGRSRLTLKVIVQRTYSRVRGFFVH